MIELEFGYTRGLPGSVNTAWGARAIMYTDSVDIPPDRQNVTGPRKEELLAALNERFPRAVLNHQAVRVHGNSDDELVLFEDHDLIVKGSAQRSFGYLYLVAYFKDDVDAAVDAAATLSPEALIEAADNARALNEERN